MDGMLYISVSKNLADGLGTFWEPHFSLTYYTVFREQPPLYFGLLAFFYKIFGTSMYVERLFCFVCFFLTLFYIHKIWKIVFIDDKKISDNTWLPILFYTTIPICFWAYSNHVEETVMTLFVTMSIYYLSLVLFIKKNKIYYLVLAGICIFLSSLTKGLQGLFPLAAVFCFWIVNNKELSLKKSIFYTLILVSLPLIIYFILIYFNTAIYDVFKLYFENRLGKTFYDTSRITTHNRFEIMFRLFTELIPMYLLMLIIYFLSNKYLAEQTQQKKYFKIFLWLLLIGFSGTFPLTITLEQRGFYLLTALPFFSIAGASLFANRIVYLVDKINNNRKLFIYSRWITATLVVFSLALIIFKIGESKRDKNLLFDVYNIGKIVPRGQIINIAYEMRTDFSLREYFIRNFYISSDDSDQPHDFFVIRKNLSNDLVPKNYALYPLITKEIDLYKMVK